MEARLNLSLKEFEKLSEKYNLIPLYVDLLADVETPLSLFLKTSEKDSFNFLLESAEGGEKWGRYSFIISGSSFYFRLRQSMGEIYDRGRVRFFKTSDPTAQLREVVESFKPYPDPELPRFWGGLVGFVAYDFVKFYEPVDDKNPDPLGTYDLYLSLTDRVIILDNLTGTMKVLCPVRIGGDVKREYRRAERMIEETLSKIVSSSAPHLHLPEGEGEMGRWESNFTKEGFEKAVERCKEYIKEGDVIQVVISQRFSRDFDGDPVSIYRALRKTNPSPYMYFLDFGDLKVIGSSPEVLVRVEGERVETRPIAGTRPRTGDPEKDRELEKELLSDEKERAEHLMLVDLARNDLGRVSERGTVKVDDFMRIEKYSHVMHIVSDVSGKLRKECDALDVLKATFPAGTVSGAPKVRAMQIIEELEGERRGIYAGAVGYISFQGNMDMAIAIRTAVVLNGRVFVQAGAGIVADSVPEKEWQETVNKAKALIKAVDSVSLPDV
jgi:anthranilate synthase component 1